MRYLRYDTAQRVTVGPFFDQSDGVTPETALTVTSEKLTLIIDVAGVPTVILDVAPTASAGANDMVHITGDDAGFYDLELAAADVNDYGRAMLSITNAAAHVPVFHEFMIVSQKFYDSMFAADVIDVNVSKWNALTTVALPLVPSVAGRALDVSAGGEAGVDWANVGSPTTAVNLTGTNIKTDQVVASVSGAVGSVAANGITATSLASDAINAASLKTDAVNKIAGVVSGSATSDGLVGGTTIIDTTRTETITNYWINNIVVITSGACLGQVRRISAFDPATDKLTVFPAFSAQIVTGVTYLITRAGAHFTTADVDDVYNAVANQTTVLGSPVGDSIAADILAIDNFVDTEIASIISTLGTMPTLAQLRTALGTNSSDVIAELGVATPAATPSVGAAIMLLYMALRNAHTSTSDTEAIKNDEGTSICTAALSDVAGTFTKGEFA